MAKKTAPTTASEAEFFRPIMPLTGPNLTPVSRLLDIISLLGPQKGL